ncbi:hypothetical protein [Rhizobium sp. S9]|nr:hypothetical protein [Rhizobium sp. S9]
MPGLFFACRTSKAELNWFRPDIDPAAAHLVVLKDGGNWLFRSKSP